MPKNFLTSKTGTLETKGVLVGSNEAVEWLLPWWWERYSACNTLPVAFVDFGLSKSARNFCEKRGELIVLDEVANKSFQTENKQWGKSYGASYETAREGWFRKPLALPKSPFAITLWCDLDCEILRNIESIFSLAKEGSFIALARELNGADSLYPIYNGGVILYRKATPLIESFAKYALSDAADYWGDDRLLSYLIDKLACDVELLSPLYNWRINQGVPVGAYIIHWVGEWGKKYIRTYGGLKPIQSEKNT